MHSFFETFEKRKVFRIVENKKGEKECEKGVLFLQKNSAGVKRAIFIDSKGIIHEIHYNHALTWY